MNRPIFGLYILDEQRRPVPVEDTLVWGRWFQDFKNRRVAHDEIVWRYTGLNVVEDLVVRVSTIFLGIDHDYGFSGRPLLWETMVFEHPSGGDFQQRFTTEADALAYHQELVRRLRAL